MINQDTHLYEEVGIALREAIPIFAKNIHEAFGRGFGTRLSSLGQELFQRGKAAVEQAQTATQKRTFQDTQRIRDIMLTHHVTSNLGISPQYYQKVMNLYPKVQPSAPTLPRNPTQAQLQAHQQLVRRYIEQRQQWNERQALLARQNQLFRDSPNIGQFAKGATDTMQRARTKEVLGRVKATRQDRKINPAYAADVLAKFRQMKKQQRRSQAAQDYKNLSPVVGKFLSRLETII